ncbi:MAG: hypothetical protein LBK68_05525, partial [Candidatus Margulisbacteria bacterium]|nr:hypothetical protein [Candidatus Margulisiibacteriota bacterium]
MPVVLPLPFQRKPKPLEPILVFDTDAVDRRDNLNIEQAPVDIETDAALSDLLARRAAVVLLNDFVLPFEAEQAEFVLSGNELDRTAKKVSASLVNLARYSSFSFDLMAVVNMTSNNWDELDTLYEYGETSYTEHINLGQRRAQKLFDFLWAAVNDRAVLNQELAVLPARQKTAAEANLRIVRANLLQLTDRAVALKLLPEYQKMCYVYDAGKGVAPPLRPEDKTPVYTYEQSLHGRNPRVGITGLVLAIVNPADQNVSQVWQDHGEATLAGLTETIAQEEKRLAEEAQEKARLEQERIALEEQQAEEAREIERLAQEEEKRLIEEAQEKARLEQERIALEEQQAEEAREIERLAQEEEKRLVEEAQAKAEEEARVKAEAEAQAKTEEEARVKAEEEARAEAEEEARIKAEEEARVKAEDEAKRKKLELTFSGGGVIKENEQAAWLQTTIMPRTFRPNIPGISSIKIGGGLNFSFHRKTERLAYRYLKPVPNVAPTANAGSDQNITLPTSSVTLDGNGSNDSDGSIASYEWTQVNGPATATIGSPAGSSTNISGLTTAGTYTFRLKVTDNDGADSTDDVIVTVNAAPPPPNVAPTANAGTDKNITLPTNSTALDGSASNDSDGSIASYEWTQVNGPVTATINTPTGSSTSISGLTTAGTYTFRLKVTDNDGAESTDEVIVIVNAAPPTPNVAPTANAGTDQSITLPTNSTTLDGSTSSDSDGNITAWEWTQVNGPVTATIGSPTGSSTSISGLTTAGTYTFRLKVTDDDGAESADEVIVIVNAAPPPPNVAPTANAGTDKNITLPTNSTTLDGSASNDSDGSIASYEWTQISKPAGAPDAVISSATGVTTNVSGLQEGTYTFRLKVTDNDGAENTDDVTVTVNAAPPPPNVAPTANAGTDKNITLPTNSTTLDGSASNDNDGSIVSYEWTQISKPASAPDAVISSATGATTNVSGLQEGTYTFRLKVTDDDGADSTDDVTVTVSAAPNVAPTANAGTDQNITLPTSNVTLDGNASSDDDGSIASYEWTQISKPASAPDAVISSATGATTNVSGLQEGTYEFQLKVIDDDGEEAVDTITITVNPQPTTTVYK